MKAHAKFNAVAKSMRYKMQNMVFDDLLDLSGIDTTKSSGYTHDAVNGLIKNGTIVTKAEVADAVPSKVILTVEEMKVVSGSVDVVSTMTANNAPAPLVASASSEYSGIPSNSFKAFDKNERTSWLSNTTSNEWLKIDLGVSVEITKYAIVAYDSFISPKDFTLQGSNNGSTWTIINTQSSQTSSKWSGGAKQTYLLSTAATYRYYRLNVTANNDGARIGIASLELLNDVNSVVVPTSVQGVYSISRDNGITWEPITPDTLFYFSDSLSPQDKNLCIKAVLPTGTQLLNYALTWA
jgi:hypothetical protein